MEPDAIDELSTLLQRAAILDVGQDGPVGRSTIAEEADCSRSTAYRQTTALAEDDLLERTDRGYRTTGAGRAVVNAVERFERTVSAIDRLKPLLRQIPDPVLRDNIHLFADADLAVANPQNPSAPIEPWLEHFDSFERSRNMVVAGCPPAVTRLALEHVRDGRNFEAICTPLALQADQNASEEAFEVIANAEAPSLYTNPDVPFTMGLIDDVVIIGGFDDDTSLPVVSATTDDPDARAWAEQLYQRHKREAEELNPTAPEHAASMIQD